MAPEKSVVTNSSELQRALTLLSEATAEAMSTGSRTAYARVDEAAAYLKSVQDNTGLTTVVTGYHSNLGSQVGVVDTTGTSGISEPASLVQVATIFGHPLQKFVATTAFQSAPDPNTVMITFSQSPDSTREQVLRQAGVLPDNKG